jgi:5-methylcytosine-specific restriction enzyme subunit McrC
LDGDREIRLTGSDFQRVRLHRNNAYYDLLLRVCRLAFDLVLPEPGGTDRLFLDATHTERELAAVFEEFVRNFYSAEQTAFRVVRRNITWDAIPLGNTGEGRLPVMQTDISLESAARRIIIDTKFYREALQQGLGPSRSFRSENLYQLFSYLKNDAASIGAHLPAEGMLIYPENGDELDGQFMIQGHRIRIATLNLCQPWQAIDVRLRSLVA